MISANDRGGLCYPNEDVIMCSAYAYVTFDKLLCVESEFLEEKEHRKILTTLAFDNIIGLDHYLFLGHNCSEHTTDFLIKTILFRIANILLKNYTRNKNDVVSTKTMPHLKRIKTSDK